MFFKNIFKIPGGSLEIVSDISWMWNIFSKNLETRGLLLLEGYCKFIYIQSYPPKQASPFSKSLKWQRKMKGNYFWSYLNFFMHIVDMLSSFTIINVKQLHDMWNYLENTPLMNSWKNFNAKYWGWCSITISNSQIIFD